MIKNTIDQFVDDVNAVVEARFGIGVHDFADFNFYDYYEDDYDRDGYDYRNAVESCSEDFIFEVESDYGVRGVF